MSGPWKIKHCLVKSVYPHSLCGCWLGKQHKEFHFPRGVRTLLSEEIRIWRKETNFAVSENHHFQTQRNKEPGCRGKASLMMEFKGLPSHPSEHYWKNSIFQLWFTFLYLFNSVFSLIYVPKKMNQETAQHRRQLAWYPMHVLQKFSCSGAISHWQWVLWGSLGFPAWLNFSTFCSLFLPPNSRSGAPLCFLGIEDSPWNAADLWSDLSSSLSPASCPIVDTKPPWATPKLTQVFWVLLLMALQSRVMLHAQRRVSRENCL